MNISTWQHLELWVTLVGCKYKIYLTHTVLYFTFKTSFELVFKRDWHENTFSFSTFGPPWSPDTSTLIRKKNSLWLTIHHVVIIRDPELVNQGQAKWCNERFQEHLFLKTFVVSFHLEPDWLALGLWGCHMVNNRLQVQTIFFIKIN